MLLASLRAHMDFQYYGFIGFNSRVQRWRFPATRPSQRRGFRPGTEGQRTNCTVGPPETAERAVIKLQPAVLECSPAQLKAATFRRWLVGGLVGWLELTAAFLSRLAASTRRKSGKEQRSSHHDLPHTSHLPATPSGRQNKEKSLQNGLSCKFQSCFSAGRWWVCRK